MKKLITSMVLTSIIFGCCAMSCRIGKGGLEAEMRNPVPTNAVIRAEVSSIGITVDQNQATQTPEAVIGYKRATYTRIPTAVGAEVSVAPVNAGINVEAGLTPNIKENLSTFTNAPAK